MKKLKKILASVLAVVFAVTLVSVSDVKLAEAEIVSTNDHYMYDNKTEQAIPKVYTVKNMIRQFSSEIATFSNPLDMFIDEHDLIYVADTGNNRVVRMDRNGENVLSVSRVLCEEHGKEQAKLDLQYAEALAKYENEEKALYEKALEEYSKKLEEYNALVDKGEDPEEPEKPVDPKPDKNNYIVTCNHSSVEKFNAPSGIYVDADGDMYVADTNNSRIVHIDSNGYFIEEFRKPDDKAIEEYPFDVTKLFISNKGVIYVLLKTDFQGLMMLDSTGKYIGNTGMTWTTTDFVSFIWSKLNPSAEAIQAATLKAPPYSNFIMDNNDWIYATITSTDEKQLAKLNSSGSNVYGTGEETNSVFGRNYFKLTDTQTYASEHFQSNFVDITVDKNGIVYALDDAIGNIFMYDQNGNNLAFFGESGDNRGKFSKPVSLNIFSDETLAVLDSKTGYITVYKDTEFCRLMKKGATLYYEAEYNKARDVWSELLNIDVNYTYAHKAIAKAYFKEEKYLTAMSEYKLAKDKAGYSNSFEKYKAKVIKDYFFLIVLIIVCAAILIFIGFKKIKKYAEKLHIKITTWGGEE